MFYHYNSLLLLLEMVAVGAIVHQAFRLLDRMESRRKDGE